jgi:ectoine hydroxylase-related dioxygenase (phytanoyl-CoA dioxygenase family)
MTPVRSTVDSPFALTETQRAALPTDDEIAGYAEHGWYLTRRVFTDEQIDELVDATERYYAGARSRTLPVRPPRLAAWQASDGPVQRHNDYVHYESDPIARVLLSPLIGAIAARLARADEIRVFQSTLIYKPPNPDEPSNLVPWHFDRHYWATSTSERMLTAFIPLHDCGEREGTITMVDGSHRWRETAQRDSTARHFADRDRGELDRMLAENAAYNGAEVRTVPMVIPKGHLSFHHCRTYHGSGPNRSGRPRRAVSFHLQDGANEYRRHTLADGSQVAYNHDAVVRRLPDGRPDYADPDYCPVLWRAAGQTS